MSNPLAKEREALRRAAARLKARTLGCRVPTLFLMTADERNVDWRSAIVDLPRGAAIIVRARDPRRRVRLAEEVLKVARPKGVLTLIASDANLAIRLRVDGVHFPNPVVARTSGLKRAMPRFLITASAHDRTELVRADRRGVDAVLLSPVFTTNSHLGVPALGPLRWALLKRDLRTTTIALGGLSAISAARVVAVGAAGIAVIGAWIGAD